MHVKHFVKGQERPQCQSLLFQKGQIDDFAKFAQQYDNRHLPSVYYILGIVLHISLQLLHEGWDPITLPSVT